MGTRGTARSIVFGMVTVALWSHSLAIGAETREPAVDGIVRDGVPFDPKDGSPDSILDGSLVQVLDAPTFEDRGIIEFGLSGLSEPGLDATLILPVYFSNGPFPFTIDVFSYAGDGALTLSDWAPGPLLTSLSYSGEPTVSIDVTCPIRAAVSAGDAFAGFNLQFAVPSGIELNGPYVSFRSSEHPPAASLVIDESPRISIDILPGRVSNSINPKSNQKISVAVLTTDSLEAAAVDSATVSFGASGTEARAVDSALEDVDGDGDTDLILHFRTRETGIACGDACAFLTGETFGGEIIRGLDSIGTRGCQ